MHKNFRDRGDQNPIYSVPRTFHGVSHLYRSSFLFFFITRCSSQLTHASTIPRSFSPYSFHNSIPLFFFSIQTDFSLFISFASLVVLLLKTTSWTLSRRWLLLFSDTDQPLHIHCWLYTISLLECVNVKFHVQQIKK